MLELNVYKNNNQDSRFFGYNYARVEYKKSMSLDDLAQHMSEHNTPFSKGVIAGIMKDMVSCIRELALEGHTIKIPDLAIFKCSVEANGVQQLKNIECRMTEVDDQGHVTNPNAAIKAVKLLAQSTGDFRRAELAGNATFRWTSKAQDAIDAARQPVQP